MRAAERKLGNEGGAELPRGAVPFMRPTQLNRLAAAAFLSTTALFSSPVNLRAKETAPLTTAAEIRALSPATAESKLPVKIRGVVTAAEPDWLGKFVIQDESAGIFVQNTGHQPKIGDYIEVNGTTGPGWFAPVIQTNEWKKLGTAPLPPAKQVPIERLMAGVEATQRVEITGMVRAVSYVASQKTMVEVSIGGYRVRVFPKLPSDMNPRSLVGAKVRVRGTASTVFNAARRQLTGVSIMVPNAGDFVVEEPELHSPFDEPIQALDEIAKFHTNSSLGERLHVKGVVTFQRPGLDLFIQDKSGGLHLESRQPMTLPLGHSIEAVGFLEIVNYQPVLRDAIYRESGEPASRMVAKPVEMSELREGLHGAELIVLSGTLLDRRVLPVRRLDTGFAGVRTICTIRHSEQSFTAEYESQQESAAINALPIGSELELTGLASLDTEEDGKLKTLTLLIPEDSGVKLIRTPSWFTSERLLIGFAIVCALLAAMVAWLLTITRKNEMLKFLMGEREKAQRELQEAHDLLELRVKERTEQLKVEMTVRKTAELEFRAVLAERTRLARDLHDTLEQALTGIALQLDTTSKLFQRNAGEASQPLELARGFLRQSQIELRRSIWDLRSRELEQFDLTEALTIASRQISSGSHIAVDIETEGEKRRLPEIVEENLLRIAQEAVTNVVKHSGATRIAIRLNFGAEAVALEIKDNGSGLNADRIASNGDHHFGLLGMSERAKRLNGRLDVSSAPGEGTIVRVVISLSSETVPELQVQVQAKP